MSNRDQVGEVQSGCCLIRRSSKAAGTADGIIEAWGACLKNRSMWLREIASAKELSLPRMWTTLIEIPCQAAIKKQAAEQLYHLRITTVPWIYYTDCSLIITVRHYPLALPMPTSDNTPHNHRQKLFARNRLQLTVFGPLSWNQSPFHHAPQPNEPEAFENMWWLDTQEASIISTPFHCSRKQNHHRRSDWYSTLSRTNSRCRGDPSISLLAYP